MRQLDKYNMQMTTGKKIQRPSDNPIIAGRALKFRSNLAQTEQYLRNTEQGVSWMEITEGAFMTVENMTKSIRDNVVSGSGDKGVEELKMISVELRQIIAQLATEMNVTYTGRYVFSGYRTDIAPTYQKDELNENYNIDQYYNIDDVEKAYSIQNGTIDTIPKYQNTITEVDIIKIPYKDATNLTVGRVDINGNPVLDANDDPINYTVVEFLKDNPLAYVAVDGQINYIAETGELVLGEDVAQELADLPKGESLNINYDKTGFVKGEPNPKVFFKCTDKTTGKSYNMDNQSLEYEFGVNTKIPINSLAKDVFTDKMYADLVALVDFIDSIELTDEKTLREFYMSAAGGGIIDSDELDEAVKEHMIREDNNAKKAAQSKFSNMIGSIDKHSQNISKEHADMGSRMIRLDFVSSRLEDDRDIYFDLMMKNEGADLVETSIMISEALATYQASLSVGAKIIQLTLMDFIR
jgi:flagellar hook-associated protein 3 FlgL